MPCPGKRCNDKNRGDLPHIHERLHHRVDRQAVGGRGNFLHGADQQPFRKHAAHARRDSDIAHGGSRVAGQQIETQQPLLRERRAAACDAGVAVAADIRTGLGGRIQQGTDLGPRGPHFIHHPDETGGGDDRIVRLHAFQGAGVDGEVSVLVERIHRNDPSVGELIVVVRLFELEILAVLFVEAAQLIQLDELAAEFIDFRLFIGDFLAQGTRARKPRKEIFDAVRYGGKSGLNRVMIAP